ncbi:MAG: ABC-type Fe3+-hydroxamate transport system, periplasmic component [Bacteroidetes bacterium]|nr:ABC-type Fe3+-hydroxamate transport system, periplasmic component [Bacteroidota bacterium]
MIFTDQLNRKIELASPPKRIISLVPSQTELLYDLGLRDEVVGITKFCIHPNEWFRTKTRVGGTKKYDFEKIKALQPDLIIGNKEENEKEQIELLMKDYNVWMSDIYTLKDALQMIAAMGALLGKNEAATNLKLGIESQFYQFQHTRVSDLRTAYFIWRKPYMVAGHDTFINEMMKLCGFENIFANLDSRYPEVSREELLEAKPELILLSSEPYPFKEQHILEFRELVPDAKVMVVDGELFSWYGSRLLKAPAYFSGLTAAAGSPE